ncbi:hypothetical protein ZOSMA_7G01160 [Zostera marina]|uniref:Uncharacterized protein n=1 Tax=Zostera marina TaxID=29655 RepID=A0A0K9NQ34_ZOSMR|nr:hypothetical protein ZOSMA_7G01160 [Zostera marina]
MEGKKTSSSPTKKTSSEIINSIFQPASPTVGGKTTSSFNDIFGPPRNQDLSSNLSSSLYYGAQDSTSIGANQNQKKMNNSTANNRKMAADHSAGSSRGDWWEGSVYY